jgi:hypothetical protein
MTILPNLPSLGAIPSLPQLGAEAGNAADGTTGGFGDTLRGAIQGVQQMEGQAQQQVTGNAGGGTSESFLRADAPGQKQSGQRVPGDFTASVLGDS